MPRVTHPKDYRPYIIINTTQRCNYRCRMCFWSKPEVARALRIDDRTMAMDLYTRALAESVPFGRALCLAGSGEFLADPVRAERLAALGEALREHPEIMLYQTTNGSLLSDENLSFLKGVKKVGFTISIDSVDALTYASIRRPGQLDVVRDGLLSLRERLQALGVEEIHLRLNMVLMKRNIFSLPDVLRFAREIEAVVFVDHPQGFGPADLDQESLFRYPVFANRFLNQCRDLAHTLNVELQCPPPFAVEPEEVTAYHGSLKERKLSCYQLDKEGPMQVSANGDVSVCCQNLVFGNLHQRSFEAIFFSDQYDRYRQAIADGNPLPPCNNCRHLYRQATYLYDASVYNINILPEVRNLDPEPDFEQEGFFDWMDELSDKQIRHHLRRDYLFRAKRLAADLVDGEWTAFETLKRLNREILDWIRHGSKVVVVPAGKQTAWLMRHSLLDSADVLAFADRNPTLQGKPFHGRPVISPGEIAGLRPDVVLMASSIHRRQLVRDLRPLSENGVKVFEI